jgi:hypothetical protein
VRWVRIAAAASLIALAVGCAKPAEPPAPPHPTPSIRLDDGVAEAASVYLVFMRDAATFDGGFADADAVQAALQRGTTYNADQLARGLVAYGAVLAMQSPDFVAGVRAYAADPAQRREILDRLAADPAYAATFPGADAAAGLIGEVLEEAAVAIEAASDRIEKDAYTIQERNDPRRRWASLPVADRTSRLEGAKLASEASRPVSEEESALLLAAAHAEPSRTPASLRAAPYKPAMTRSLSIAARALLGESVTDDGSDGVLQDPNATFCLQMSKLNLFQCLAAAKPSYEDMFCIGRHVVRDLADCTRMAVNPTWR